MSTDRPLVVSVVVADGLVGSFGLGVCAEVFGYDRRHMGLPRFDFALVTEAPGVMRTDTGIPITVEHGLERLAHSDIVSITAWELFDRVPSPVLLDALREAYARGATIVSHCTGAFVLAEAGLLDGKRVTPHREWGAAAANALAREMVVPPHRDGGQAQFIDAPVAECQDDLLGAVLEWAQNHLADDLSVELLAHRALMSPRSFARRFKATTGTTPHAWLLGRRLAAAEALLEDSDAPVEEIARLVGFGTAAGLREQFTRRRGVSPRAYRQTFRAGSAAGTAPVQLDGHRARAGRVRRDESRVEAGLDQ